MVASQGINPLSPHSLEITQFFNSGLNQMCGVDFVRVIGLDYGDRTIGVAASDPLGLTAQPVEVIRRKEERDLKGSIKRIREILEEYGSNTVVLGYPKNMNNSEGSRCEKTVYFKNRLENSIHGIDIILKDERLSTAAAERTLLEADLSRQKRGKVIDKMAAVFILQGYLDTVFKNKMENEKIKENNKNKKDCEGLDWTI